MAKYDYTSKSEEMQEDNKFNSWFSKIVNKLPKNLDEKAKELGAITRKRVIKDATSFLRMLLLYAITPTSTRLLAFFGGIIDAGNMSDTAWRKRINKAVPWLSFVLGYLLDSMIDNAQGAHSIGRRVILHDCSSIRQIGSNNTVWRMHTSYDIANSHISSVEVTDHHVAESLTHAQIKEGDIVISDAGYGKSSQIKYVLSQKADLITRITPNSISIYDECHEKISIINLLNGKKSLKYVGLYAMGTSIIQSE